MPISATGATPPARISMFSAHWGLDPSLTFLNHGSYGAVPKVVLQAQADLRARVERDPVRFYKVDLERLMDGVRQRVGEFINCDPADIAPVQNATVAICSVFHNTAWEAGDEILVTDHEYTSGLNELERMARMHGVKVVSARVPWPTASADQVFDAIMERVSPRTRLAVFSHITSATSLIFPAERLVPALEGRGIEVLLDSTHAPGQIPLDVKALNPTYLCGSFHKWMSAPKGTGFLYVRRDKQSGFRTIALSSRANKVRPERALFLRDFDYMGTDDYTGMLAVPAAIDFLGSLVAGGWPALMEHNHNLVVRAREVLCERVGLKPPCPESMLGTMATLIIPEAGAGMEGRPTLYDDPLQDALVDRHGIVVPIWRHDATNTRLIRVSAMAYNTVDQYERLAEALRVELKAEGAA